MIHCGFHCALEYRHYNASIDVSPIDGVCLQPHNTTSSMTHRKIGLWIIGAFGAVGATVALGVAALRRGLIDSTGLVTNLPMFAGLNLEDPANFVIGGHEVQQGNLVDSASRVGGCRPAFSSSLLETCRIDLDQWTKQVRNGSRWQDES